VGQVHKVSQSQGGKGFLFFAEQIARCGKGGEITVGSGKNNHVAGSLTEIHGFRAVTDTSGLRRQQMHG